MTNHRGKFSLILPKIDQDHKEIKLVSEINSTNSLTYEKEKLDLSLPTLLDNNNNNTYKKRRILQYRHLNLSSQTQRPTNSELYHGTKTYGTNLHGGKTHEHNLKSENILEKFALPRDKHIAISPAVERLSHLHHDPLYLGMKCTICADNMRVRQKQTRVKNCSILGDSNGLTKGKLMQGIQRQDVVDIDESIELGSIKKCNAWMETWFTEDGKPKEQTDDNDELTID